MTLKIIHIPNIGGHNEESISHLLLALLCLEHKVSK